MTKSTITREHLQEMLEWCEVFRRHPRLDDIAEAIRMALAAMDSEPVAEVVSIYGDPEAFGEREIRPLVGIQQMPYGTKLYRHAQPVPVVLDAVDTNLIEALRLVQCMLDDYRERNYGDAQGWIRHINTHMSDYTEAHGDDAYSVLHNLITAAPQSPGSEPATVPGKWIPVSERMPESNKFVLVSNGVWVGQGLYDDSEHLESDEHWQDEHREFINVLHHPVTHWMPLPSAPQEPKP
ncbi:Eaa1 [Klebsiella variicola]|nr:DUF551 domain-containing protein [Klebsiella variicola]SXE19859.1 Eaa1 [Klebsiella variicola]